MEGVEGLYEGGKCMDVLADLTGLVDDMSRRLDNLEATIQTGDGSKGSGSGK